LVQPNDLTWFVAQYRGWVMVLVTGWRPESGV